jgi:hypothetical protein
LAGDIFMLVAALVAAFFGYIALVGGNGYK